MTRVRMYIQVQQRRISVPSLFPYLLYSLYRSVLMEKDRIPEAYRETCRWAGCGIGKGVTHPEHHISVFGVPDTAQSGLHGQLIQGFPDVDDPPLCYDEHSHKNGFGGFIRWIYLASPTEPPGFLGIDFSIIARPTSGIANSVSVVTQIVTTAAAHGVPLDSEVALLNWHMCEDEGIRDMRYAAGLISVQDWIDRGKKLFSEESAFCPRCGLKTLDEPCNFCHRCGAKPALFWKRR